VTCFTPPKACTDAVKAWQLVAASQPTGPIFFQLAVAAFLANDNKLGERAAAKSLALTPKSQRATYEAGFKAAKAQAKADAKRPVKHIKEEKRPQPGVEESEEVEPVEESVEESEEVDPLEEFEELEEAPPSPLSPPPEETEPVVEQEPEPVVEKPKMKKFKFQGVSYVVDEANIVYRKDAPKVRIGVYTEDGLVFDEKDEEESEEDLSDIEK
jgi:hypothetical protein